MPTPSASRGLAGATTAPSHSMRPASARWMPVRQPISVDLPAPFSPTRPWISPGSTARSTPPSAATPPNRLARPETRRRATGLDSGGPLPPGFASAPNPSVSAPPSSAPGALTPVPAASSSAPASPTLALRTAPPGSAPAPVAPMLGTLTAAPVPGGRDSGPASFTLAPAAGSTRPEVTLPAAPALSRNRRRGSRASRGWRARGRPRARPRRPPGSRRASRRRWSPWPRSPGARCPRPRCSPR